MDRLCRDLFLNANELTIEGANEHTSYADSFDLLVHYLTTTPRQDIQPNHLQQAVRFPSFFDLSVIGKVNVIQSNWFVGRLRQILQPDIQSFSRAQKLDVLVSIFDLCVHHFEIFANLCYQTVHRLIHTKCMEIFRLDHIPEVRQHVAFEKANQLCSMMINASLI